MSTKSVRAPEGLVVQLEGRNGQALIDIEGHVAGRLLADASPLHALVLSGYGDHAAPELSPPARLPSRDLRLGLRRRSRRPRVSKVVDPGLHFPSLARTAIWSHIFRMLPCLRELPVRGALDAVGGQTVVHTRPLSIHKGSGRGVCVLALAQAGRAGLAGSTPVRWWRVDHGPVLLTPNWTLTRDLMASGTISLNRSAHGFTTTAAVREVAAISKSQATPLRSGTAVVSVMLS